MFTLPNINVWKVRSTHSLTSYNSKNIWIKKKSHLFWDFLLSWLPLLSDCDTNFQISLMMLKPEEPATYLTLPSGCSQRNLKSLYEMWTCYVVQPYFFSVFSKINEGTTVQLHNYPNLKSEKHQWNSLFTHSTNHQLPSISPPSPLILSITTATATVQIFLPYQDFLYSNSLLTPLLSLQYFTPPMHFTVLKFQEHLVLKSCELIKF